MELRDTESLPGKAHKQLDKNRKSRRMKTEDGQKVRCREAGGQTERRTSKTDMLAENRSSCTKGVI